jgi:hypothetical protein
MKTPKDIDEYIAGFPIEVQKLLETIRKTIRKAAPGAGEAIKYQIPTFTLNGNLISFAAYKTTSVSIRHRETRRSSRTNWRPTKVIRALYNFLWTSQFPSTSLAGL